ncbi:shaker-related potassium channel tsha2-like [Watersipora subatra]|uniref:shaker-related potassium channel tsha2-like n=1 Tax=Watersipora subatra TaxID=2589382 RepID=UPI00355BC475
MANWSVALARPLVPRNRKKARHVNATTVLQSPSLLLAAEPEPMEPLFQNYGNVFRHLCRPDEGEHSCYDSGCERITVNVSGLHFVTRKSVFEAHPTTLLGNADKRKPYYDEMTEEYFFDRHRATFESIFNYYKYGGKLKRPPSVTDDVFLDELNFFQVEEEVVKEYKKEEGYTETKYEYPDNEVLAKIWALFEYPETSRLAFFIGIISVFATLVSIVTFTLETLPRLDSSMTLHAEPIDYEKLFFGIETLCNIWFTFEAVVRFITCPNKLLFWTDVKNIIDIVAILPYYVALIQTSSPDSKCGAGNDFAFLRVIRLIRVFKLTKHSQGLQILLLTFQSSMEGLTLFVLTLMVCILVFSSMIYFCEIDEEDTQITSIPDGFWWAVITMCTVGYGDVVPVGNYGKMVGAICALSGVLTLAIPVPIITENFNKFYVHKQRARAKEVSRETILDKAHEHFMKVASCCKEKVNCNRDGESGELTMTATNI